MKEKITCSYCGKPVKQTKGKRQRQFCSDKCRTANWKKNVAPLKLSLDKTLMKQFFDDLVQHGVAVSHSDGVQLRRIDPMSNEAAAIRFGIDSQEMTPDEIKDKFGVEVKGIPLPKDFVEIKNVKAVTPEGKTFDVTPPIREKGESAIDFAARKNEWKKRQNL